MTRRKKRKKPTPGPVVAARPVAEPTGETGGGRGLPLTIAQAAPVVALVLMALAAYWPALSADFVWDDKAFLGAPPVIEFFGLADIWLKPGSIEFEGHYWPLVYSTFWLEHKLWGFNPFAFHLTNILLHAAVSVVLWRLLERLAVPGAWAAAAVFALHPVHVEAVAWVIARKDLLAALCYLLGVGAFLRFRERRRAGAYVAVVAWFAAGMLSKSFVITMPAVLLVWVWWRQGKVTWGDALQVAPLLLIGLILAAFDLFHYSARAELDFEYSLAERIVIAAKALWFYAGKLLWPQPLLAIYPLMDASPTRVFNWLPLLGAVAVAGGLFWARRRIGRGALVGALFFAIVASPMLGLVGDNAFVLFSFVADRYQYLASAGLIVVGIAAAARVYRRLPLWAMRGGRVLAALALVGLGVLTFRQAQVFQDENALFGHVIAHNPDAYHVYFNYGNALMEAKRWEEAAAALSEAARRDPDTVNIHINLGVTRLELSQYTDAEQAFRHAVALEPDNFQARQNLAAALRRLRRFEESLQAMRAATELTSQPTARHYFYMGRDAAELQRWGEAAGYFEQALALDPAHAEAKKALLFAYLAAADYVRALELEPALPQVLDQLGYAHFNAGRVDEAVEVYRHSVNITPDNAHTHANLGAAQARLGRYEAARKSLRHALRLDPRLASARANLRHVDKRLGATVE